MSNIRKIHSKEYEQLIEINIPVRFYWGENKEYDGFEFGPLDKCSKHQIRLLYIVINQLMEDSNNSKIVRYLQKHDKTRLIDIIHGIQSDELGVPKEFLSAFNDGEA